MEQIIKRFYKKIRLDPDPDVFTALLFVSLISLGLGVYNSYLLRNSSVSLNNTAKVESQKFLPLKDLIKNISDNAPRIGNSKAKVVMVGFEDFQCPFCKRFHDEAFGKIKKEYIDTGKVLFIHQDLAFLGLESSAGAEAAQCANDQGKFWEYRDYLYSGQGVENSGNLSDVNLKKIANNLGLNMVQFSECLDGKKYKKYINEAREFANSYGISSTPSFVINGVIIKGARPFEDFESIINNQLK